MLTHFGKLGSYSLFDFPYVATLKDKFCCSVLADCQSSETDSMAWVVPVVAVQGFLLLVAVPVITGLCILRKHVCVYMYYMF